MKDINIKGSTVTFGNNSPINIDSKVSVDWQRLQNDCLDLISKGDPEEINKYKLKDLMKFIIAEDMNSIKKYTKRYSGIFASNIICNLASGFLLEFLKTNM